MRKVEKAAIEFIQQNKSLDGHSVYFQKSLQKESTAYTNLWELVRKFKVVSFLNPLISLNRNVPLHETNKVTIIVANDCLFDLDNYMKASCKKRDRKYRQKVDDREIQGSKNTEDNPKHSTISDCRELLATYWKMPSRPLVIRMKKMLDLAKEYLKPYTAEFHRESGAKISWSRKNKYISIVCFDKSKVRGSKCKPRPKRYLCDWHEFDNYEDRLDVHKIVLDSPCNIPLFLDKLENNYLDNHRKELENKYRKIKHKLSLIEQWKSEFYVPKPSEGHNSCIVCFKRFSNYYKHIEGEGHLKKTHSDDFKDHYAKIDSIFEDLNNETARVKAKQEVGSAFISEFVCFSSHYFCYLFKIYSFVCFL